PVRFVGGENRFVLKSMISISTPSPSAAGVIRSLSIVPVRMPSGRRRRKRNSLQRPGDDCGLALPPSCPAGDLALRIADSGFGVLNLESADGCAAITR